MSLLRRYPCDIQRGVVAQERFKDPIYQGNMKDSSGLTETHILLR